jgi:hypothetical protein
MKKIAVVVAVALSLPTSAAARQAGIDAAAATITREDYARRIGVIAHDSMQGRDTPSAGLEKTASWIAAEFQRMGLRGGAPDGGFVQRYPLEQVTLDVEGSSVTVGGVRLSFGPQVTPLFGVTADAEVSGDVALLTGDVSNASLPSGSLVGKHAVVVLPQAAGVSGRAAFALVGLARQAGAVSVLIVSDLDEAGWKRQAARGLRASVHRPGESSGRRGGTPIMLVREEALAGVLAGRGVDLGALMDAAPSEPTVRQLAGLSLVLTQRVRVSETSAPNVVAVLDGSDPELKNEYVVYSGHMDHVGMGSPDANGDSIFNGADDDASGTVSVIEVAQAMASMAVAPKRSGIFLLVSGEEKGLWGSEYYTSNPTAPMDAIVADLNTDMVGRNWPDTIVAIGKEHSDLGATLERVNARHPELHMTAIDDIWPEERFYFRSDHYNFAQKGVPILFFFNGTHDDYHGLDDEPERIDAEKAARISRLVFYLGVEIANAADRPRWNPESYRRIVSDRN